MWVVVTVLCGFYRADSRVTETIAHHGRADFRWMAVLSLSLPSVPLQCQLSPSQSPASESVTLHIVLFFRSFSLLIFISLDLCPFPAFFLIFYLLLGALHVTECYGCQRIVCRIWWFHSIIWILRYWNSGPPVSVPSSSWYSRPLLPDSAYHWLM